MPTSRRAFLGKSFLALGAGIIAKGTLTGPVNAAPNQALAIKDLNRVLQNGSVDPQQLTQYMDRHFSSPAFEHGLPVRIRTVSQQFSSNNLDATNGYSRGSSMREMIQSSTRNTPVKVTVEAYVYDTAAIDQLQALYNTMSFGKRHRAYIVFSEGPEEV